MKPAKLKYRIAPEEVSSATFDLQEYNVSVVSREIYLHGYRDLEVEEEPGMEYRMATKFIKNLNLLNNQGREPILVHQHTVGGNWNDGMAIYDAIVASISPVVILAYAHARSMSSITFQGASLRVMMPNADFMVHQGTVYVEDTVLGAQTHMATCRENDETMLDIYSSKCKGSQKFHNTSKGEICKYIRRKMEEKQEWYLTAQEAVKYGFADGVLGDKGLKNIDALRRA